MGRGLVALALVAGVASAARAAPAVQRPDAPPPPPPSRLERRTVVRFDVNVACLGCGTGGSGNVSDASAIALTVAHNFTEAWALEGTVGYEDNARYSTTIATPMTPAMTSKLDLSAGKTVMLGARWAPLLWGWGRRHSLSLEGGPFVIAGGAYGTIPFLHGEVAYEYRPPFPFTVLFGIGRDVALADSPSSVTSACFSYEFFGTWCRRPFRAGDLPWHLRAAIGVSF
jgi:hypothetical protein